MQLHHLVSKKIRETQRIGRGGKRGTFSGRGTKGQKARAGAKIRPAIRDVLKKIPKLRGSKFKSFRPQPQVINLDTLQNKFPNGGIISPESLVKSGLVAKIKGKTPVIKILGRGESKVNFVFRDVLLSRSVKTKLRS